MTFMEECIICEKISNLFVIISRCCCSSDVICNDCLNTKTLREYYDKAVKV